MDKGYEKETFAGLRIKISVALKFRSFSKRQGKSHSMTLLAMVEFFDHNGISPDERMHETIASLKYLIKRRFNAMVAIMRSIEKEQTLPTVSMIQALFQQELESEEGEEGKNKMLVLNNVRNKLVLRVCAVVKRQTPYQKSVA